MQNNKRKNFKDGQINRTNSKRKGNDKYEDKRKRKRIHDQRVQLPRYIY